MQEPPPQKKSLNVSSFKGVDEIVKYLPTYSSSGLAHNCLKDRTYEGGGRLAGSIGKAGDL